jgi:hypothetical protein
LNTLLAPSREETDLGEAEDLLLTAHYDGVGDPRTAPTGGGRAPLAARPTMAV